MEIEKVVDFIVILKQKYITIDLLFCTKTAMSERHGYQSCIIQMFTNKLFSSISTLFLHGK